MEQIQATLIPNKGLFLWSADEPANEIIRRHLPTLWPKTTSTTVSLAVSGNLKKRVKTKGQVISIVDAIQLLGTLPGNAKVSDSVRVWSLATKLALELATRQMVVPAIDGGQAKWRVLLSKEIDRDRYRRLVNALPAVSRANPTRSRGHVKVMTAAAAVRNYLDETVNTVYRTDSYPGPSRGWAREVAHALRGGVDTFAPKDARFHSIPSLLSEWSVAAERSPLTVGVSLELPYSPTGRFKVILKLHSSGDSTAGVPINKAFKAGAQIKMAGVTFKHPAHAAIQGLARAARVFPPLKEALDGAEPQDTWWNASQTWDFLDYGVSALRDAGFVVTIPEAFEAAGHQRVRARIRVNGPKNNLSVGGSLKFQWEVVLGDRILDGDTCAKLLSSNDPIVWFDEEWVLLDPADLSKLPKNISDSGKLNTTDAIRAILTGMHEGTPVIADSSMSDLIATIRDPAHTPVPKSLNAKLRPYQVRGFSWLATLYRLGLGACLADDMGLGKTIQVITLFLHLTRQKKPNLVVCPTSVLGNWNREIKKFAPSLKVKTFHGTTRSGNFDNAHVILTTYGVLVRDQKLLQETDWNIIVLDEAQAIKNPTSQRARAAGSLEAVQKLALTGTPVENRLDELWSLMNFILPGLLGLRGNFQRRFGVPIERFGDKEVAARLKRGIGPFLLRRVKTDPDIISDLPDKIERRAYCPLTEEQVELYKEAVNTHLGKIKKTKSIERHGQVLALLTRLKQICNHPAHYLGQDGPLDDRSGKLKRTSYLVDSISNSGEQVIIFTQYKQMGLRLQSYFSDRLGVNVPFLHGGTTPRNRDRLVDNFQNKQTHTPIFIISLRAGGTGLNLTAATHVIHYDRWWNPAVEDQATDRAYRIGQKHNVQVHKLITEGTLEEKIDRLLEDKRALADTVVGAGERWIAQLDDDELNQLVALDKDAYGKTQ